MRILLIKLTLEGLVPGNIILAVWIWRKFSFRLLYGKRKPDPQFKGKPAELYLIKQQNAFIDNSIC